MALACDRLKINSEHCSVNYSPGRVKSQPQAFVLHSIPTYTTDSYLAFTKQKYGFGRTYNNGGPKSVHFLIGDDGSVYKLVELHDRAWGISELKDPSWPYLSQDWVDFEDLFIHIGFIGPKPTTTQVNAAAELICCISVNEASINIPVNEFGIIVARDLNIDLEALYSIPDSIIPKAQVCIQNKGKDPFRIDDIGTYGSRISDLEAWRDATENRLIDLEVCCCENRQAISDLQDALEELQSTVQEINIDDLLQRLTTLEDGNYAIWKAIRIIQNCLDCANICTPETPASIHYRLDIANSVKLTPGVIQHLNLPIKVRDVDPPIVTTGPLWYGELTEEAQTLCTTFKIKASARLNSSEWCAGRKLELYAIVNSEPILINTYTAEGGSQSAYVYGETIFTVPPDSVVYLGLKTDEDTFPLEVIMASIQIECLDGLLSPNCTECDTV